MTSMLEKTRRSVEEIMGALTQNLIGEGDVAVPGEFVFGGSTRAVLTVVARRANRATLGL